MFPRREGLRQRQLDLDHPAIWSVDTRLSKDPSEISSVFEQQVNRTLCFLPAAEWALQFWSGLYTYDTALLLGHYAPGAKGEAQARFRA
jgi:hypothetical protein